MWPFTKAKPLAEMIVVLVGHNLYLGFRDLDSETAKELGKISPTLPYMFYFDRAVGNMSDLRAWHAIDTMLKITNTTIAQVKSIKNEQEWEKKRRYISTGEKWNLVSSQQSIEEIIKTLSPEDAVYVLRAKATVYISGERIYCNTEFSNTTDIESEATLSLKAIFIYLTASLSFGEYVLFLASFQAQLVSYDGHKPLITNLGKAVLTGLQYAKEFREKNGGQHDE